MNAEDTWPLRDVARLRLEPGDVLVVRLSRDVSPAEQRRMIENLEPLIAPNRGMIVGPDADIEVISKPPPAPPAPCERTHEIVAWPLTCDTRLSGYELEPLGVGIDRAGVVAWVRRRVPTPELVEQYTRWHGGPGQVEFVITGADERVWPGHHGQTWKYLGTIPHPRPLGWTEGDHVFWRTCDPPKPKRPR